MGVVTQGMLLSVWVGALYHRLRRTPEFWRPVRSVAGPPSRLLASREVDVDPKDPRRRALTALDWIGFCVAALPALFLIGWSLFFVRGYVAMFEDFDMALPVLTRLVLSPRFALVLAGAIGAALLGTLAVPGLGWKRALIVATFLLGLGAVALCIAGVYLPVFQMADAIS